MSIYKLKSILAKESLLKEYIDRIDITKNKNRYHIWNRGCRYGEAKITGNELILYQDRFWKDDIIQVEVQRIAL